MKFRWLLDFARKSTSGRKHSASGNLVEATESLNSQMDFVLHLFAAEVSLAHCYVGVHANVDPVGEFRSAGTDPRAERTKPFRLGSFSALALATGAT